MTVHLPDQLKKFLDDTVFIVVGTVQPDGSPQLSPVWVKRDGDDLLFSTLADNRKARNLLRDPHVSVIVQPFDSPYTYAEIRGTASLDRSGGRALIDELTRKYTGHATYTDLNGGVPEQGERVAVRITPRKIVGNLG
ncbi:PPOX class F420-dependent oxidoreductase [Streptomyces sp. NPDC060006]|uniref:PPOX class F420-dependent oxidoreductase n=1 Tax=unclassified Streptomyces TaxID=2593676 RepID=UPI00367F5863